MISATMAQGIVFAAGFSLTGLTADERAGDLAVVAGVLFVVAGIIMFVGAARLFFRAHDDGWLKRNLRVVVITLFSGFGLMFLVKGLAALAS